MAVEKKKKKKIDSRWDNEEPLGFGLILFFIFNGYKSGNCFLFI